MKQKRLCAHIGCYWLLLALISIFVISPSSQLLAEDLDIIEDPKPTHTAKEFIPLRLVKEISSDFDEKQFFARPTSMAVDDQGAIFIYDQGRKVIIKFNKDFKWEKTFGSQGRGPGEFTGNDSGLKKIYFSPNGHLYVNAPYNRKLIAFSKDGKHIKDIRLPGELIMKDFLPVVDKQGNLYATSVNEGAVDIYNKDMELIHSLLDKKDYKRFLFYPVIGLRPNMKFGPYSSNNDNTYYNILGDGTVVIQIAYSSRTFIFKNKKLINHFDFWPKKSLDMYKQMNAKKIKKRRNGYNGYSNLLYALIPDMDMPSCFYLQSFPGNLLYKVDTDGNLIQALEIKDAGCRFEAKRNGLFYGFSPKNEHIRIYKIKKRGKK